MYFASTGVFAFGLFATDIFVNAGQVVTGNLAPYFLIVCKPNYTGTECRFNHQFISNGNICTGNQGVVEKARRSFPSKDASLSVYSAVYVTVRMLCYSYIVYIVIFIFYSFNLIYCLHLATFYVWKHVVLEEWSNQIKENLERWTDLCDRTLYCWLRTRLSHQWKS